MLDVYQRLIPSSRADLQASAARRRERMQRENERRKPEVPAKPEVLKTIRPMSLPLLGYRFFLPAQPTYRITFNGPVAPRAIRYGAILQATAKYFDLAMIELLSRRRTKHVARPRMVAMYLGRRLTMLSFPEIAKRTGGRDHTTALSGVARIEYLRANNSDVQDAINAIAAMVGGKL